MNKYYGVIVAGDSIEKTITIYCEGGVSGVILNTQVEVVPWFNKTKENNSHNILRKTILKELQG